MKAVKTIQSVTEEQLKQQIELKRKEREEKLIQELTEWCKKNNCTITTSVPVHINGQQLGIILKAL